MRKLYKILFTLFAGCLLSAQVMAQSLTVTGTVKDSQGEPLMGATIRLKNKPAVGTSADENGRFTLKVNPNDVLTISFVGYQTQDVTAQNSMSITLLDNNKLNEIVVIGYGGVKKNDLTGSVTAIKPDEMNHGLNTTAQDMIVGKIAGVNVTTNGGAPGSGTTIRIRGGSSLNASNDPLIVIDGLAMDNYGVKGLSNPLSMVNPNDIESFTILKDASATAIYGSRASNGVIIITTKKGRAGSKPRVSYNGNVSISTKHKTLDVMNGPEYTEFIKNMFGENSAAYKDLGWYDNNGVQHFANTDWQNEILQTAISTDHNLTISGGLKHMPYRVSMGFTNQPGIVITSKFQRYTASFNLSPELFDEHLKLNINGKGMLAKSRFADGGAIGSAVYMDPTKPISANNDIFNKYFGGYTQWYAAAVDDKGNNVFNDPSWPYQPEGNATSNPVAMLKQKDDRATSKNLIGNLEADYKIHGFEDLHLHANAGINYSTGKQNTDVSPYSKGNFYYGSYSWKKEDSYNMSLNTYAQYIKDVAEIHHFDAMAGYEWQHFHVSRNEYYCGYYQPTNADATLAGKLYNTPTSETREKSENYLVSFFGRFNYSLLDRYLLTLTLREDGSSRFSSKNRWGLFPSVAFAWKMKEEKFLKNVNAISDMKLRLGYGVTGQQEGIGDYTYFASYTLNGNHAYYPIGVNSDGSTNRPDAYNNNLTWEKTKTYNIGMDFGFLDNRIVFNIDYYYRKTTDLINDVFVSAGSNFSNKVTSNIGSLHNQGIEFSTTVRPIQTKDWRWELTYNLTYNNNKIDELVESNGSNYVVEVGNISAGTGGFIQAHAVGHPAYSFYVYQQVYGKDGKPLANTFVDRDGNGVINSNDRYFYKKPTADVLMGLSSKLMYKNWDFGFTLRLSLGNYAYNDIQAGSANVGSASIYYSNQYLSNRPWVSVNNHMTTLQEEQYRSDYFVQNASFLRCDNISLGYSFDHIFGAKISGRAYATMQNVFTITKYKGLDPEVGYSGSGANFTNGIDNNLYPRPFVTVLGIGLNL